MLYLVYEKESGFVIGSINSDTPPEVMNHHDTIVAETKPDFQTVKVVNGELVESISPQYIESRKEKLKTAIVGGRDAKLAEGFETQWGTIQADLASRTNINAAVLRANADPEFAANWRMRDNTYAAVDAACMITIGGMLAEFVTTIYERSFLLKAQLADITTLVELNAFEIIYP